MTVIEKIIGVFGEFEGAPDDLMGECDRWVKTFTGHEDRLRTLMLQRRMARRWVPIEEVATTLGLEVAVEAQPRTLGPIEYQWCEASTSWPCGPKERAARMRQMQHAAQNPLDEDKAKTWIQELNAIRVSEGNRPHPLIGPARYRVLSQWRETRQGMHKKGRYQLTADPESVFYARLRAADLEDSAAGWEVPPSPTAQAQAEEEADAGLPALARRFVGR